MAIRTDAVRPVAVVGSGDHLTARVLRHLIELPVVELTPYRAAWEDEGKNYRAVVVENFDRKGTEALSPCGAARWALSRRADVTVVGLDDGEGRRLARCSGLPVYSYSDGRPQADLTAKNVRLSGRRLEFEALTCRELIPIRIPLLDEPCLYDYLAALAAALAVGVPLKTAAERLTLRI